MNSYNPSSQGAITGTALGVNTIATSQQSLFDEPDYRISVHKARNGLVVAIRFAHTAHRYDSAVELWIVPEDHKVQDVIAAAIAAHGLGAK